MRFKAVISKQNLAALIGIIQSMERIGNTAAIFLSPEFVRIALITDNVDLPKCYIELAQTCLFLEYHIESQSDNNLLFEISLHNFVNALSSGKNAIQSVIKLVKRDNVS